MNNGWFPFNNFGKIQIDVSKEDIKKNVDILCSAGYVPSFTNGGAPKKIMNCKTIFFNHSVPACGSICMNVIKPEDIGDATVKTASCFHYLFGFNIMKSELDELTIQLEHSNDVYRELKASRECGRPPSQRVVEIVKKYNMCEELKALNKINPCRCAVTQEEIAEHTREHEHRRAEIIKKFDKYHNFIIDFQYYEF